MTKIDRLIAQKGLHDFCFRRVYNLGQNKMEQQTPIPPSPKSRILDLRGEWEYKFSIYFVPDCSMLPRSQPYCSNNKSLLKMNTEQEVFPPGHFS